MYVPPPNAVGSEDEIRSMVAATGAAQLVTVGENGYPIATLLPVVWTGDVVVAHLTKANPHWKQIADDSPALLVVEGPQAYISPSWYATKAEHGRVVPTWNYSGVQLTGRVRLHHDPAWLRHAVDLLTAVHEAPRAAPWATTDAPDAFVAGQLRGIVGLEFTVETFTGKAKLSQNRSVADRHGVVAGLRGEVSPDAVVMAEQISSTLP